jgi:hypothetical protein
MNKSSPTDAGRDLIPSASDTSHIFDGFNAEQYAASYPDVGLSGMNPREHYVKIGRYLSRNAPAPYNLSETERHQPSPGAPAVTGTDLRSNTDLTDRDSDVSIMGFIDFPLENDYIGSDYLKIGGWCSMGGEEIERVTAYLKNSKRKSELKPGLYRGDVCKIFSHIINPNVGFEGTIYPYIKSDERITLTVEVVTFSGLTHLMERSLLRHPLLLKNPMNEHCASSLVYQELNGTNIYALK